jgi:plasmid maintenance system killer protein
MKYELRWANEEVKEKWGALKRSTSKQDINLVKSIRRTLDKLEYNPFSRGVNIPKDRIPLSLKMEYSLHNLFKIDINDNWRLVYYAKSLDRDATLVIVIDFMTHTEYNRLFGYN